MVRIERVEFNPGILSDLNESDSTNGKKMKKFWVSWYQTTEDYRPLNFPPNESIIGWWCSGYQCNDEAATICAAVVAEDEEKAMEAVLIDWPEVKEWRFVNEKDEFSLGDRFLVKDTGWSRERFNKWGFRQIRPPIQ